jgi:hypothetical protein
VRIEAHSKDPKGSGATEYSFNADGFGPPPECNPNAPPAFELKGSVPSDGSSGGGGAKVEVKAGASVNAK